VTKEAGFLCESSAAARDGLHAPTPIVPATKHSRPPVRTPAFIHTAFPTKWQCEWGCSESPKGTLLFVRGSRIEAKRKLSRAAEYSYSFQESGHRAPETKWMSVTAPKTLRDILAQVPDAPPLPGDEL
jgi:hypothetical protein